MPTDPFTYAGRASSRSGASLVAAARKKSRSTAQTGMTQVGPVKDAKPGGGQMGGASGGRSVMAANAPTGPGPSIDRKKILTERERARRTFRKNAGYGDTRKLSSAKAAKLKQQGFIGGKAQGYWGGDGKFHPQRGR